MDRPKITLIGGGSLGWTLSVTNSHLLEELLPPAHFCLMDISPENLPLNLSVCEKLNQLRRRSCTFSTTTSLDAALEDADLVMVTITHGGYLADRKDHEICARRGVHHTVGDTVGPAGLSRALRNIPVFIGLARRMEELCPEAWMVNLSNPLAVITRAVAKATRIRAVGLCHGVQYFQDSLRSFFAREPGDHFEAPFIGTNHLSFVLDVRVNGRSRWDGVEELARMSRAEREQRIQHMDSFEGYTNIHLALDMYRELRVLPMIHDRHLAEFYAGFLTDHDAQIRDQIPQHFFGGVEEYRESRRQYLQRVAAGLEKPADVQLKDAPEKISVAKLTGASYTGVFNLPNTGQAANLPLGAVIECAATVGSSGFLPLVVGDVPLSIAAHLVPHLVRQELLVEAALRCDRHLAYNVAYTELPMTAPAQARELVDELIAAQRSLLPKEYFA